MSSGQEIFSEVVTVLGTAAFALSAVLAASKRRVDIFSLIILGLITSIGGGTMRDLMLDVPVFWSQDLSYVWISISASLLGFVFFGLLKKRWINEFYLHIDAFAIALFAIQATNKAWALGFGLPIAPVFMGLITAVGGGIVRDMLMQRPTLLFESELYAIPIALGCAMHCVVLSLAPQWSVLSSTLCILLIIAGRSLSIYFNIGVPNWALLGQKFTLVKMREGED
ncbi:trimeric intracellular cation channel family protein [Vibrio maritimus]|uniref:trimeric intracellular cation channel family protein n=1 Tax=Vibrio maritimus TaxID=990268 RepID=UPI001F41771A|nr:trimeric intracellular cation channel family protein [Vibrio maritimus]